MALTSGIKMAFIEDFTTGALEEQCVIEGRCEFFGMGLSRFADGTIDIQLSNQTGTAGSAVTYDVTKQLLRVDLGDTGDANFTPYYMILPGGTSILFDTGMSLKSDTGTVAPNTMTIFYRQ